MSDCCLRPMNESTGMDNCFPSVPPFTGPVGSAAQQTQSNASIDPETFVDYSGEKITNYIDVGFGASLYDNTIGSLWRAATGTVSVDGKKILIHDEMVQLMMASGYNTTWNAVYNQSNQDVTGVLKQAKADPTDAGLGNNPGLDNLKKWLEIGAALVALYLVVELLSDLDILKKE